MTMYEMDQHPDYVRMAIYGYDIRDVIEASDRKIEQSKGIRDGGVTTGVLEGVAYWQQAFYVKVR